MNTIIVVEYFDENGNQIRDEEKATDLLDVYLQQKRMLKKLALKVGLQESQVKGKDHAFLETLINDHLDLLNKQNAPSQSNRKLSITFQDESILVTYERYNSFVKLYNDLSELIRFAKEKIKILNRDHPGEQDRIFEMTSVPLIDYDDIISHIQHKSQDDYNNIFEVLSNDSHSSNSD